MFEVAALKKENLGQVLLVLHEAWANEFLVRGRLWKLVLDLWQASMLASPAHPNVARKLQQALATFEYGSWVPQGGNYANCVKTCIGDLLGRMWRAGYL